MGSSIAIVGSAPSATAFSRKEDYVIGVNGASLLLNEGDYFCSCDDLGYKRSWFSNASALTCFLRPHAAMHSNLFYDKSVLDDYFHLMDEKPHLFEKFRGETPPKLDEPELDEFFSNLPQPYNSHVLLYGTSYSGKVSPLQENLLRGGTSSCVALQIAFLMGASNIHLYGIEFSNQAKDFSGSNYFYNPQSTELGMTSESQRESMDQVIKKIGAYSVPIFSHGPTNLENSIQLEPMILAS